MMFASDLRKGTALSRIVAITHDVNVCTMVTDPVKAYGLAHAAGSEQIMRSRPGRITGACFRRIKAFSSALGRGLVRPA